MEATCCTASMVSFKEPANSEAGTFKHPVCKSSVMLQLANGMKLLLKKAHNKTNKSNCFPAGNGLSEAISKYGTS